MVRTGDHNHPDRAGVVVSRGNDLAQLCAAEMEAVAFDLEELILLVAQVSSGNTG